MIIGGGVMGASTAYHLALRGQKNILLLEKDEFFGQEATGRCAGGVRFQFSTEINVRLSLESLPMLDRFKEEIGQEINFRKCGYLFVLTNARRCKDLPAQPGAPAEPWGTDRMAYARTNSDSACH